MIAKLKRNRGLVVLTITILSILIVMLGNQPIIAYIYH
jgi:hypothetical protein